MATSPTFSNNSVVRSGNKLTVIAAGVPVGLAQSVTMNDQYSPEAASGIGDIHAFEYVPTFARHSITVSQLLLNINSMIAAGVVPENGNIVLQGITFDFQITDRVDGTLIRAYRRCTYSGGSIEVNKHSIVSTSAEFLAVDVVGTANGSLVPGTA